MEPRPSSFVVVMLAWCAYAWCAHVQQLRARTIIADLEGPVDRSYRDPNVTAIVLCSEQLRVEASTKKAKPGSPEPEEMLFEQVI